MNRDISPATRAQLEKAISGGYFDQLDRLLNRARLIAESLASAANHADFTGLDILNEAQTAALSGTVAQDIETALLLLNGLYQDMQEAAKAASGKGEA